MWWRINPESPMPRMVLASPASYRSELVLGENQPRSPGFVTIEFCAFSIILSRLARTIEGDIHELIIVNMDWPLRVCACHGSPLFTIHDLPRLLPRTSTALIFELRILPQDTFQYGS